MEWVQWIVIGILALLLGVQARRIEMLEDWRANQEQKAERERGKE